MWVLMSKLISPTALSVGAPSPKLLPSSLKLSSIMLS